MVRERDRDIRRDEDRAELVDHRPLGGVVNAIAEAGVWPYFVASGGGAVPPLVPLATFSQGHQVHHGGGVIRVPFHARSLQPERQVLAHGFRRPRADVPAASQRPAVIQHFEPFGDIAA